VYGGKSNNYGDERIEFVNIKAKYELKRIISSK